MHSAIRMILLLFPHLSVGCVRLFKVVNSMSWNIPFFNPVKLKLMCFNYVSSDKPYITLCGKPVDNDLHLGNCIYNYIYTQCSNSMISDFYRANNPVKSSLECEIVLL